MSFRPSSQEYRVGGASEQPIRGWRVVAAAWLVALGVSATPALAAGGPDHLSCQVHEESAGRVVLRGCASSEILPLGEAGAREFLHHHAQEIGLELSLADLLLVDERAGLGAVRSRFQQMLLGLPVYDANILVNQSNDGSVQGLYSNYRSLVPGTSTPAISAAEAEVVAQAAAGVLSTRLPTVAELVWFPRANGMATLAWKVMVYAEAPLGDFLTLVDAGSGKLLSQEDRIAFDTGSGFVYDPNPMQTSGNLTLSDANDATSTALDAERVNATLLGLDAGVGTLKGEYVDLVSLAGGLGGADANEVTRVYEYTRANRRFEQVVVYHAIDSMQRYFHSLGFDDDVGAANGIRDFPTLANAHWDNDDQSFYSTGDNAVHFGDGGVDDAEDADIIAHEYGHAVQHDQNSCWGGGEMGAMGEGFGDYLAASFYASKGDAAYQSANDACVGEWDATSFSGTSPPCLRRVDGTKTYPADLVSQVHADGEIWSRALWDLRGAVGATTADTLVLEHHVTAPCNASMTDAANEVIQADSNLFAGANEAAIRQAFCDRGILAGAACVAPSGLSLAYAVSPNPVVAGQVATLTLTATNSSGGSLSAIVLSATVPTGSSYVAASASDSGAESGGTVTWPSVNISSASQAQRSFQVQVAAGAGTSILFSDDMESGGAAWVTSHGSGTLDWSLSTTNPHKIENAVEPKAAAASACSGGIADIYPCENVDLHNYLPMATIGGGAGTDGWGWTDPVTGTEYVLMGRSSGTSFIDISDPANPVYVGDLPTHTVNNDWRDMKVYSDHAFIVSEASGHGMQVFDLTQLRSVVSPPVTFTSTAHYSGFSNAHNIAINEATGFAYAVGTSVCSGGLHMIDISTPAAPISAGCFSSDGYTHDVQCVVYAGPDSAHLGKEICLASNEDTVTIVDVSIKSAPVQLSRTAYTGSAYTHQGWLTDDHRYFLVDDELDEQNFGHATKTLVWDMVDLDNPVLVGSHLSSLPAIDHNQYIVGDLVYQANYQAGLRILKIQDLATADLCEVGSFDVYPASNGAAFNGAWNVYPFFASGVVAVHAIEGLAIVQPQLTGVTCPPGPPAAESAWFASDPASISDHYLAMASPVTLGGASELQFWHDFITESSYDGGVVEYSTDSGATWNDIGALIIQNGYTGTISSSFSNPIGGRSAFEGTSSGYIQTLADLSSLAGQAFQVRFRMASDTSIAGTGWYVDDVLIGATVTLASTGQATGGASDSVNLVATVVAGSANNSPVLATNAGLSLAEGANSLVGSAQLQVTDADAGDTLTYTVTSAPVSGSLNLGSSFTQAQIDASGLSYSQDGSEVTSDGFTFTVSDGNGGTVGSSVFAITITPTNDSPVLAANAGAGVAEGGSVGIGTASLEATDPDLPGDTLTYSVIAAPTAGSLNLGSSFTQADIDLGDLTYTQNGSEVTSDSFSFTVSDGNGGTVGSSLFTLTITPVNDNPVLVVNAGATVAEGGNVILGSAALLTSDPDLPGDTLTYTLVSGPSNGSLNLSPSFTQAQVSGGSLNYSHDGGETASDSFTFSVSDGNGGAVASSLFPITVIPVNDAPSLGLAGFPDATVGIAYSVLITPTDPDVGDVLSVQLVSGPGWLVPPVDNGNGTWTLAGIPQPGDEGNPVVTLRVTDSGTPALDEQLALPLVVGASGGAVPTLGFWLTVLLVALMAALGAQRAALIGRTQDPNASA